jgi:membrane associated rhomboid family serine protease
MTKRFPLFTVVLASLIVLFSSLSLGKILPNATMFYLDSGLFQGTSPWAPLSYWLFVDKAPSLILALLPLFLFGPSVESLLSRKRLALIFFGGVILAAIVFAISFSSLGPVKAANGALCGGVSLAGAAFVLSISGRVPHSDATQLPLWVLSLLFLGGVIWTSSLVSEAMIENILFRASGFLVGVFIVSVSIFREPESHPDALASTLPQGGG